MALDPFGHAPVGVSNQPLPSDGWLYLEPSPRRIRGFVGDQAIVDSTRAMLLFQNGRLPRYYFPLGDVRTELLEALAQLLRGLLDAGHAAVTHEVPGAWSSLAHAQQTASSLARALGHVDPGMDRRRPCRCECATLG